VRILSATRPIPAALLLQSDQADHTFSTRLTGFLDILYVLAVLLGVVLFFVAIYALLVYLKRRGEKDLPQ
jgi:hypothetical protein